MDSLTLRKMIEFAETAMRWTSEAGPAWIEQEQVRAAVAMYLGQVGEIVNREIAPAEVSANPDLFGELGAFRNRIYHHYYRDFRVDVLEATVGLELPDKVDLWKAKLPEIEAEERARED